MAEWYIRFYYWKRKYRWVYKDGSVKKIKKLSEIEEKIGFLYNIEKEIITEYYDFDMPSREEEFEDIIKIYNKFLNEAEWNTRIYEIM